MTVFVGCLLALVRVWSQIYTSQANAKVKSEVASNAADDNSEEASFSMASFSLPSPVHVQINLDPHCLFEIIFEDAKAEAPQVSLPSIEEKLFVTLFRVIISPNAP
jgi:hypothetical protein